jgi:glyoxylase-like metal-dependent hydrolase (beta-lactamase superfamily II)
MTDIAGVHRIELEIVGAYLLETETGRVLVDTGLPHTQGTLMSELERIGGPPPELIVLTHAHMDHVGGLHATVDALGGTPVAAHTEEAGLLARGETSRGLLPAPHCPDDLREMIKQPLPKIDPVEVQIRLSDGDTVPGFPSLTAIYTPGHSAGHISLLWHHGDGVLIVGDAAANVFELMPPPVAEDFDVTDASLRKLAGLEFDAAVFGHGPVIASGASSAFREAWAPATA